jgi:uncharacterized protein
MSAISSTPISLSNRNFSIDVMRGFAILGILLMNIPGFSGPDLFMEWGDVFAGKLTMDGFIFKSAMVLFDGKMRGLFTLLFGAGLMLFIENKDNTIKTADLYFKRLMWLLVFGLVDAYLLLWGGDVLYEYALCGLFLFSLRNLRVRYMLLISFIALLFHTCLDCRSFYENRNKYEAYFEAGKIVSAGKKLTEEQQNSKKEFEKLFSNLYPFSKELVKEVSADMAENLKIHHQGYTEILEAHSKEVYEYQATEMYLGIWESFGTVLLGMALFKWGFFTYRFKMRTYALICFIGIPIGWLFYSLGQWYQFQTKIEMLVTYQWRWISTSFFEQSGRLITTFGYASLILLLCRVNWMKGCLNLFANTGRMALTNYIMQTILCSLFFFGFGFNQYGIHSAHYLLIFVLCIWIIQITYSNIYLRFFQMGPMEWLWRRLTYGKNKSG